MPNVEIGKLALEVPGLAPESGRRLAELVVEGLAGVEWPSAAPARVSATVPGEAGSGNVEHLAAAIVAELRRQLS